MAKTQSFDESVNQIVQFLKEDVRNMKGVVCSNFELGKESDIEPDLWKSLLSNAIKYFEKRGYYCDLYVNGDERDCEIIIAKESYYISAISVLIRLRTSSQISEYVYRVLLGKLTGMSDAKIKEALKDLDEEEDDEWIE